jgi:hypothetical protein
LNVLLVSQTDNSPLNDIASCFHTGISTYAGHSYTLSIVNISFVTYS